MKKITVKISDEDRLELEKSANQSDKASVRKRASILLALADGAAISEVAEQTGASRQTVRMWRDRYVNEGLKALDRQSGGGKRGKISTSVREEVIAKFRNRLEKNRKPSLRKLAGEFGISPASVSRMLRSAGIDPQKPAQESNDVEPDTSGTAEKAESKSLPQRPGPSRRVTIEDVANHCGVHPATASRALNNRRTVAEPTRRQIQAAARELGYRRDPFLSGLVHHRKSNHHNRIHAAIGIISDPVARYERFEIYREYMIGAKERANELGYNAHHFEMPWEKPERLVRMLHARGIEILVFLPMSHAERRIEMPLEDFFSVAIGRSIAYPDMHRVADHNRASVTTLFNQLRKLGYRRFAMDITEVADRRTDYAWRAGFLQEQSRLRPEEEATLLVASPDITYHEHQQRIVPGWLKSFGAEVIITINSIRGIRWHSRHWNLSIPEDLGYACLSCESSDGPASGIYENRRTVARSAVDRATALFFQNDRGVPAHPSTTLIKGTWAPGETVRQIREPSVVNV